VPQAQDFERALGRVNEPRVRDTRAGIDPQLASAVDTLGRGREDLTNPVGSDCEECRVRHGWQSSTPPTGQVGYRHVLAEVELGLVQDPPASGASVLIVERGEDGAETRRGDRVPRGRPRAQEELAVQDL